MAAYRLPGPLYSAIDGDFFHLQNLPLGSDDPVT